MTSGKVKLLSLSLFCLSICLTSGYMPEGTACSGGDDCNSSKGLICPFGSQPRVCTCESPSGKTVGRNNTGVKMYFNKDLDQCVFARDSGCVVEPHFLIFNPTCEPGVRCHPFEDEPAFGKCSASGVSANQLLLGLTILITATFTKVRVQSTL
jgi:hypothetical protein